MLIKRIDGPVSVKMPDGTVLTRSDLPPLNTTRWVARRKATVVRAVAAGMLTREEACDMYALSIEEFDNWLSAMAKFGHGGLRVTKIQKYKQL